MEFWPVWRSCAAPGTHSRSQCGVCVPAHGLPPPSWIAVCAGHLCTRPAELKCRAQTFCWSAGGQGLCTLHPMSKWKWCQDLLKLGFFMSHEEGIRREAKWQVRSRFTKGTHSIECRPSQKARGPGRYTFHRMWSVSKGLRAVFYFHYSPHNTVCRIVSPTSI